MPVPLVASRFASVYGLIATLQANAFYLDPRTNLHTGPDRFDSSTTVLEMTSLGPLGSYRSRRKLFVSILEAILGVLYLAC